LTLFVFFIQAYAGNHGPEKNLPELPLGVQQLIFSDATDRQTLQHLGPISKKVLEWVRRSETAYPVGKSVFSASSEEEPAESYERFAAQWLKPKSCLDEDIVLLQRFLGPLYLNLENCQPSLSFFLAIDQSRVRGLILPKSWAQISILQDSDFNRVIQQHKRNHPSQNEEVLRDLVSSHASATFTWTQWTQILRRISQMQDCLHVGLRAHPGPYMLQELLRALHFLKKIKTFEFSGRLFHLCPYRKAVLPKLYSHASPAAASDSTGGPMIFQLGLQGPVSSARVQHEKFYDYQAFFELLASWKSLETLKLDNLLVNDLVDSKNEFLALADPDDVDEKDLDTLKSHHLLFQLAHFMELLAGFLARQASTLEHFKVFSLSFEGSSLLRNFYAETPDDCNSCISNRLDHAHRQFAKGLSLQKHLTKLSLIPVPRFQGFSGYFKSNGDEGFLREVILGGLEFGKIRKLVLGGLQLNKESLASQDGFLHLMEVLSGKPMGTARSGLFGGACAPSPLRSLNFIGLQIDDAAGMDLFCSFPCLPYLQSFSLTDGRILPKDTVMQLQLQDQGPHFQVAAMEADSESSSGDADDADETEPSDLPEEDDPALPFYYESMQFSDSEELASPETKIVPLPDRAAQCFAMFARQENLRDLHLCFSSTPEFSRCLAQGIAQHLSAHPMHVLSLPAIELELLTPGQLYGLLPRLLEVNHLVVGRLAANLKAFLLELQTFLPQAEKQAVAARKFSVLQSLDLSYLQQDLLPGFPKAAIEPKPDNDVTSELKNLLVHFPDLQELNVQGQNFDTKSFLMWRVQWMQNQAHAASMGNAQAPSGVAFKKLSVSLDSNVSWREIFKNWDQLCALCAQLASFYPEQRSFVLSFDWVKPFEMTPFQYAPFETRLCRVKRFIRSQKNKTRFAEIAQSHGGRFISDNEVTFRKKVVTPLNFEMTVPFRL
jgi:hypothetical protein